MQTSVIIKMIFNKEREEVSRGGDMGVMAVLPFSFHLEECFPKAESREWQGGAVLEEVEALKIVLKFEQWQWSLTFTINSSTQVSSGSCKVYTHTQNVCLFVCFLICSFLPPSLLPSFLFSFLVLIVLSCLTFLHLSAFHMTLFSCPEFSTPFGSMCPSPYLINTSFLVLFGSVYYRIYIGEIFVT